MKRAYRRELVHGTLSGYVYRGCRCEECRQANRDYYGHRPQAEVNAEREPAHGTESRYSHRGCRCDDCRRAASDAKRQRRLATRVPCSHGCGTMVDSINRANPHKPPECHPCSLRRIWAERKAEA